MIVGIARNRQPPPLDRIRKDHRRPVRRGVRLLQRLDHLRKVVAPKIAHHARQLRIAYRRQKLLQARIPAPFHRYKPPPQLVARQPHQQLVLLVAHVVNALANLFTVLLRKKILQLAPVLRLQHLPAPTVKHRLQRPRPDARNHPVQALTVQVHDPERVGQLRHPLIKDSLPHVALVQLRIADDGNEPIRRHVAKVLLSIVVRQRRKCRRHRAQPHRARGKINRIGILRPAWIRLQTAKGAQRRQILARQLAQKILDGVKDRRRMRLYRNSVPMPQQMKIERRHDRHHACRRSLVPANLDAVPLRPHIVRLMHNAQGQPQHPVLNPVKCLQVLPCQFQISVPNLVSGFPPAFSAGLAPHNRPARLSHRNYSIFQPLAAPTVTPRPSPPARIQSPCAHAPDHTTASRPRIRRKPPHILHQGESTPAQKLAQCPRG